MVEKTTVHKNLEGLVREQITITDSNAQGLPSKEDLISRYFFMHTDISRREAEINNTYTSISRIIDEELKETNETLHVIESKAKELILRQETVHIGYAAVIPSNILEFIQKTTEEKHGIIDWMNGYINSLNETKAMVHSLNNEAIQVLKEKTIDAGFDPLTGLYNRKRADFELEASKTKPRYNAVLFIDINNFKKLNDTYGHDFGDVFLKGLGKTINEADLDPSDFVARYGGDEFIVLFNVKDKGEDGVKVVADKVYNSMFGTNYDTLCRYVSEASDKKYTQNKVKDILDKEKVNASIGASYSKFRSNSIEPLIKTADECMYATKYSTKAKSGLYRSSENIQISEYVA